MIRNQLKQKKGKVMQQTSANKTFIPGKTPIYYSGPYWDEKELESAVKALMNGKWLASGENVHKFEKKFSRMFNQKYSVMVNSGSSANLVMIAAIKNAEIPVATIVEGKAISCGVILASCGTKGYRYITEDATLMIHDVSSFTYGKNSEIQRNSDRPSGK